MLREKSLGSLRDPGLGLFWVWGSVWDSDLGFIYKLSDLGFKVSDIGLKVSGLGFIGFQISGFRVSE